MAKGSVILAISDDKEDRQWAQIVHLGKPVLVSDHETAWDTIDKMKGRLHSVLIRVESYEKGLALAVIATKASCFYVGVISPTVPGRLDRIPIIVGRYSLIVLQHDDALVLDNGLTDWVTFYESITDGGPIIVTLPY